MSTRTIYGWSTDMNDAMKEMVGLTFDSVTAIDDELVFESDQKDFRFFHSQDCCESVYIEDIAGDLKDLQDSPIVMAEEVTNYDAPPPKPKWADRFPDYPYTPESYTWTFYKFATNKGSVTVRFYGESNGYYSESVSLNITEPDSDS